MTKKFIQNKKISQMHLVQDDSIFMSAVVVGPSCVVTQSLLIADMSTF